MIWFKEEVEFCPGGNGFASDGVAIANVMPQALNSCKIRVTSLPTSSHLKTDNILWKQSHHFATLCQDYGDFQSFLSCSKFFRETCLA